MQTAEPLENEMENQEVVCPRDNYLDRHRRNAKIQVGLCNLSAKKITILAKANLCQLTEIKVLFEKFMDRHFFINKCSLKNKTKQQMKNIQKTKKTVTEN